jgi:hypothetical protein
LATFRNFFFIFAICQTDGLAMQEKKNTQFIGPRMERTRKHIVTDIYAFGIYNCAGEKPCEVASGRTDKVK